MRWLFSLLFNRYVFIALGLLALVLVIWFLGPLFAFADWRPLEPVPARLWTIGIVLGLLALRLLVLFWRRQHVNARLLNAIANARAGATPEQPTDAALEELRGNFEQALEKLKQVRFQDREQGWFARLRQKYVYQIPWYVFIGAPGSGKTTALINSGLRFPLAEEFGRESVKGVGGTRNCDWWFSDETVLLDTAGRYTTHESDAAADKAEWEGFLGLLKKFRPRQPLNGALLTVSVSDLLGASEAERGRHAARLRARLNELHDALGISFPVYVLVTKADLLGGFNEYFATLSKEERAQVWGVTLPYNADGGLQGEALGQALQGELELLAHRLFDEMPELMLAEHDTARRACAYALPQHFHALIPVLRQLLQDVFAESRFARQAMMRGLYFTSGTQEGTPFDRVLGGLGRSLGFDARVALRSSPAGTGRSYFLQDVLRKVIFPEAHLAGRNQRAERRERLLGIAGHGAVALLLVLALGAWALSFGNNSRYIDLVDGRTERMAGQLQTLAASEGESLLELVPVLTELNGLAAGPDFPASEPPIGYTYGLYQGGKLDASAQRTYQAALERALLPRIVRRLEFLLQTTPEDNLELTYEVLKSYLMLNDPSHYDGEALEAFVRMEWERSLPISVSQQQREQLFGHLHNLLAEKSVASPYPQDEELVRQKREQLATFSLAHRAYSRLKLRLMDGSRVDFTVAEAGGPQSALVFTRASGKPLTQGIPALFTHDGYHKVFLPEAGSILGLLEREEDWVLGRPQRPLTDQATRLVDGATLRDIKRLYLHEYVRLWDEYLADVRLIETPSMSQGMEVARILSAPDSPLAQFLRAVARETTLLKVDPKTDSQYSVVGEAGKRVKTAAADLERVFGPSGLTRPAANAEQLERIVDDRFEPIRRLVTNDGGNAPIQAVLRLFNEMYMNLSSADSALRSGASPALASTPQLTELNRIRAEAAYLPAPLRTMLEALADAGTAQAGGSMRVMLGGKLDSSLGAFCRQAINGRYPFRRSSEKDVTLADFSRLFAYGGMFDSFFQDNLAPLADMSGRTWLLRQPGGVEVPLTSFQRAARIRDVFFPYGARSPEMSFSIRVLEMDASISQLSLDFDGQVFQYAHGPQVPQQVKWPGPRGTQQVRLELMNSGAPSGYLVKNGPWAAMRLFDEGENRAVSGPERFVSTLMVQGRKVVLEVTAGSVQNPFRLAELASFSCPGQI
jgi:type VI secretion system protein ImpL